MNYVTFKDMVLKDSSFQTRDEKDTLRLSYSILGKLR